MPIIFLIGFMGSGKSTLGKKIASKTKFTFLDTDHEIEKNENNSVSTIFLEKGEIYFRNCEKNLIESFSFPSNTIVALGGGLPCFSNLMDVLNSKGITIYLKRPPKELVARLMQGTSKRPLLQDKNEEELLEYIENTLMEREVFYMQSKIILDRDQQNSQTIIDLLNLPF